MFVLITLFSYPELLDGQSSRSTHNVTDGENRVKDDILR